MNPKKILLLVSFALLTLSSVCLAHGSPPADQPKIKTDVKHELLAKEFVVKTEIISINNMILEPGTAITKPIQKVVDHSFADRSSSITGINKPIRYLNSSGKFDYAIFKLPSTTYQTNRKLKTKPITYRMPDSKLAST